MSFRTFRTLAATLGLSVLSTLATSTWAQDYPNKPITFLVPFGAGSGTDQVARLYGKAVSEQLGVPVVVENKGGASGFIAAQQMARAAPDGYTVFITTNTTQVANPYLFEKVPYDPVKDFAPVTLLATGQMLLLVRPDSPYKTLADLLAAARKAPGQLNFGAGSSSSLVASELLKQMAGVKVTYIPYQSNPKALADLLGGRINFMFADAPTAIPQVQGGKLRPLAASGAKRLASMPDVPTVDEAGVKGYDMTYWFAAYLPAHAPAAVVQKLNEAFAKASDAPEVKAFRTKTSTEAELTTPQGLAKFQAAESEKWGRVIGAAGIKPR